MGKVYAGINGLAGEVKKIYAGVGGIAREVKKVYAGVNGIAEQVWPPAGGAILPDAFQQVLYIESSGTQYIDTGIAPVFRSTSGTMLMSMRMQWTEIPSDGVIAGVRYASGDNRVNIGYYRQNWSLAYGANYYNTGGAAATGTDYEIEAYYEYGAQYLQINGTKVVEKSVRSALSFTRNLYLFRNNYSTAAAVKIKLYGCKISQDDELQRDYYPCYRKADNEAGLYDLENGVFYANAGTGSFTPGPNYEGILS